ncbi:cytochrome P450 family protein [Streptococcus suis]|uniref:Uncharacterized protein n=1 Tax=Streptococcus suis TaxID=1307 RepID=A0AAD0KVE6_STRSU|nr:hypothetical protein [Streptococcus suis]AWX95161.1 hypothetical protein BKM66_03060 [Streptococcus suis]AWX97109.1 hypothetical protein BKM67_03340 [Streptococcus suis]MBS8055577.1 hypothetical protein [Streptococcus suis]MCL4943544.1 cytochrome P450 [Streptococcus suis]HEM3486538.1 hypothetical protein [Streptococcus suis]
MSIQNRIEEMYKDHEVKPYISPERDLAAWLLEAKPVPKRNMIRLEEGLLAGDIILLWRVNFGTFTTTTPYSKYFEYIYGINGPAHMEKLLAEGYVYLESAFDSLDHITSTAKKNILKAEGVTGLSKMKAADLDTALKDHLTEEKLAPYFAVRGYALTEKGRAALENHQEVIDKHPKKKM